ncbi:MAG: hypothetical protein AAF492_03350 [Verrucomicrobiota bacterium]
MNRDQFEQLILLEQSGELSPDQQVELDRYLAEHPEAASYRDDVRHLTNEARKAPIDLTVSELTMERIMGEAEKAVRTPKKDKPLWIQVLKAAALLGLALGLFLAFKPGGSGHIAKTPEQAPPEPPPRVFAWADDAIDEEISTLETVFSMSDELYAGEPDIDDLARQLLELENPEI